MEIIKKKTNANCFCDKKKIQKNKIIYKLKPYGETDFRIRRQNYYRVYHHCTNCNHYFASHNFDLEKLYQKNYSKNTYGSQKKIRNTFEKIINLPLYKSDNKNRIKRILKIVKKHYKCLDVGSGLGIFPFELKKNSIKVDCIEKDNNLKRHLKNLKLKLKSNEIFHKNSKIQYDFISMNKVLEHIQKPNIFIDKFLKLLKNNGILYLEVPSIKALKDKLGSKREEFFIEHFHVFSKKSVILFLKKKKLKIIYIKDLIEKSGKYTLIAVAKKI